MLFTFIEFTTVFSTFNLQFLEYSYNKILSQKFSQKRNFFPKNVFSPPKNIIWGEITGNKYIIKARFYAICGSFGKIPKNTVSKKHYVTGRTLSSSKRQFRTSSFPFKFKEKIYDKIRILLYKNLIFLRFLLCFSKIKRPQDFILISRSDSFLRICGGITDQLLHCFQSYLYRITPTHSLYTIFCYISICFNKTYYFCNNYSLIIYFAVSDNAFFEVKISKATAVISFDCVCVFIEILSQLFPFK